MRVTNPRGNDVLFAPIKDGTYGDGAKEKPYQFTKGLNYEEMKNKIDSPHVKSLDSKLISQKEQEVIMALNYYQYLQIKQNLLLHITLKIII